MKTFVLPLFLAGFCLVSSLKAGVIYTFNDQTAFDNEFQVRNVVGDSTISLLSNPSAVQLYSLQQTSPSQATVGAGIFGKSTNELNFLDSTITISFSNVIFSHYTPGSTYSAEMGIFASTKGSVRGDSAHNPVNGIYVFFDRYQNRISVVQQYNKTNIELAYWGLLTPTPGVFTFDRISLTLSADAWSLDAVDSTGKKYTNATAAVNSLHPGTYATQWTGAAWGSEFHLGMEADNIQSRWVSLTVGQVAAIPEPKTAALVGAFIVAAAFSKRLRSSLR